MKTVAKKVLRNQSLAEDEIIYADFSEIRFDDLARSMGAHGERVSHPDQLGPALHRCVDSGLPDRQFDLNRHCIDGMGLIVVAGSGGMLTRSTDWGATWQPGRIVGSAAASQ